MIAALAKKTEVLEAAFWAKAESVKIPVDELSIEFYLSVWPFGDLIYDRWLKRDGEAKRLFHRIQRIEQAELPIHPAFLKGEHEAIRRAQWAWYHRADYRVLYVKLWQRMLAEVAPLYDVKATGLVGVALQLFEKEIDEWMEDREYISYPASREELACNQIELWNRSARINHTAGDPDDMKTREELWRRAIIEQIEYCYGRKMTEEELLLDWKMWKQVREDMAAGKDASESEGALYFRDLFERYPRKSGLSTYLPGEEAKF